MDENMASLATQNLLELDDDKCQDGSDYYNPFKQQKQQVKKTKAMRSKSNSRNIFTDNNLKDLESDQEGKGENLYLWNPNQKVLKRKSMFDRIEDDQENCQPESGYQNENDYRHERMLIEQQFYYCKDNDIDFSAIYMPYNFNSGVKGYSRQIGLFQLEREMIEQLKDQKKSMGIKTSKKIINSSIQAKKENCMLQQEIPLKQQIKFHRQMQKIIKINSDNIQQENQIKESKINQKPKNEVLPIKNFSFKQNHQKTKSISTSSTLQNKKQTQISTKIEEPENQQLIKSSNADIELMAKLREKYVRQKQIVSQGMFIKTLTKQNKIINQINQGEEQEKLSQNNNDPTSKYLQSIQKLQDQMSYQNDQIYQLNFSNQKNSDEKNQNYSLNKENFVLSKSQVYNNLENENSNNKSFFEERKNSLFSNQKEKQKFQSQYKGLLYSQDFPKFQNRVNKNSSNKQNQNQKSPQKINSLSPIFKNFKSQQQIIDSLINYDFYLKTEQNENHQISVNEKNLLLPSIRIKTHL